MIQVTRPAEPQSLVHRRQAALAALVPLSVNGQTKQQISDALKNYDQGKALLRTGQHNKCLFCDRYAALDSNPLEHFRPKRGAIRSKPGVNPKKTDADHYWWLCWTWENHTFSCVPCNNRKGNHFEVAQPMPLPKTGPGLTTLAASAFDWTGEGASLVDPTTEDPLDHLEWYPTNTQATRKLWRWQVRGITLRGDYTKEVLRLSDNLEHVGDHIVRNLVDEVEAVRSSAGAGTLAAASHVWDALLAKRVEDKQAELRGASWWALHHLVPPSDRNSWGLRNPIRP